MIWYLYIVQNAETRYCHGYTRGSCTQRSRQSRPEPKDDAYTREPELTVRNNKTRFAYSWSAPSAEAPPMGPVQTLQSVVQDVAFLEKPRDLVYQLECDVLWHMPGGCSRHPLPFWHVPLFWFGSDFLPLLCSSAPLNMEKTWFPISKSGNCKYV